MTIIQELERNNAQLRQWCNERDDEIRALRSSLPVWRPKNAKPAKHGWHYVRYVNGKTGMRYYDGTWWNSTARDGWTPNDSFSEWMHVPRIHANDGTQP
jgi:hypothetical protein